MSSNLKTYNSEETSVIAREPALGDPNIVRVLFSNSASYMLTVSDWVEIGLKLNEIVSEKQMLEVERRARSVEAERTAVAYLTNRVKTSSQVKTYLVRKGVEDDVIEQVIARLQRRGIVNDEQYAAWFIERESGRMSRRQLFSKLLQRGISRDIVKQALGEHVPDGAEHDVALRTATKYVRQKGLPTSRNERLRLMQNLARKGFASDLIQRVMSELEQMDDDSSTSFS